MRYAPKADHPTLSNIREIAKLEEESLARRTAAEKVSDTVVKRIGSVYFLVFNLLLVSGWIAANPKSTGLAVFDPFPFGILALVISAEAVFLTIFVLISQNRMARAADRRSHLDLQIGMLTEQELTTMLQLLQQLCDHTGVDVQASRQLVEDFKASTDVRKLADELADKLPE